jgi:hypothetical protein
VEAQRQRRSDGQAYFTIPQLASRWVCSRAEVYAILRASAAKVLDIGEGSKRSKTLVPAEVVARLGFVPGNIRWALRDTQSRNQQHKRLGKFSDEEFAVEARRRGFVRVKPSAIKSQARWTKIDSLLIAIQRDLARRKGSRKPK